MDRLAELRGAGVDGFRTSAVVFAHVDADEAHAWATAMQVLGTRYGQDFDRYLDAFCAVGSPSRVTERIEEFRAAGVQDILLSPSAPASEFEDQVDRLAAAVRR